LKLDFYNEDDLALIIENNAKKLEINFNEETLKIVAKKSR